MLTPCVGIYVITVYYAPKLSSFLCISLFCIQFIHRYSVQWTVISLVHIGVPWTVLKLFCTYSNKLSSDLHTYRMYHIYVRTALALLCTLCNLLYSNILQWTTWQSLVWDINHIMLSTVELFNTVEISHTRNNYLILFTGLQSLLLPCCTEILYTSHTVCPCVPVWDLSEQILIYCLVICISC